MTITAPGLGNSSILKFPIPFATRGSTGLAFGNIFPYPRSDVMEFLSTVDYGNPQGEDRDCEDMAFYGIAQARCKFPGVPTAAALGTAKEGGEGITGTKHAVILLWFESQENREKKWDKIYFDPTIGRQVNDFAIDVIIPFPIAPLGKSQNIKPFDQIPNINKAAFALDKGYRFDLHEDIIEDLQNMALNECKKPDNFIEQITFAKFFSFEDRVFFLFTEARKKHMGAAIGYAFGSVTTGNKPPVDFACLALWKTQNILPEFWAVGKGPLANFRKTKFEPRIIIA